MIGDAYRHIEGASNDTREREKERDMNFSIFSSSRSPPLLSGSIDWLNVLFLFYLKIRFTENIKYFLLIFSIELLIEKNLNKNRFLTFVLTNKYFRSVRCVKNVLFVCFSAHRTPTIFNIDNLIIWSDWREKRMHLFYWKKKDSRKKQTESAQYQIINRDEFFVFDDNSWEKKHWCKNIFK